MQAVEGAGWYISLGEDGSVQVVMESVAQSSQGRSVDYRCRSRSRSRNRSGRGGGRRAAGSWVDQAGL